MSTSVLSLSPIRIRTILIDLAALAVIYFMPAFSHMLAIPVYYIEPMRLMLILAIVFTGRTNAYFLALTLPIFSYFISAHPVFLKALLISIELVVNVWLFYTLIRFIRNEFIAMAIAIIGSKLFYYAIKIGLLNAALLQGKLISIPIYIQLSTTIVFSLLVLLVFWNNRRKVERAGED